MMSLKQHASSPKVKQEAKQSLKKFLGAANVVV